MNPEQNLNWRTWDELRSLCGGRDLDGFRQCLEKSDSVWRCSRCSEEVEPFRQRFYRAALRIFGAWRKLRQVKHR